MNLLKHVVLLAIIFNLGCFKKKATDYNLDVAETLRINLGNEPPSLDWSKASDTTSSMITDNIMSGMVAYDLLDLNLKAIPGLAESWSSDSEAKNWTFKIKRGVLWTDGVELEAQHFKDGWTRLLAPETASVYAYFLFGIQNAQEFNQGKIKDPDQMGIEVVDKYTIKVRLTSSMSYFPYLLTHQSTYPIRLDVVKKHGERWTEAGNIVTLGAYSLKIWEHDKALVLERNPQYYGKKAKIKNILCYIINEASTAINLFDAGRLDIQLTIPSTELSHLKRRPEYRANGILGIYYLGFNTQKHPIKDVRVRKAISMAIDRNEIVKMLAGDQKPLSAWVPAGMMGHEPDVGLIFDVEKAKNLLDQAGYKDRSKFPKLIYGFNTNENHKLIAENIQAQLKRNLGIEIELQNEEWKVFLKSLKTDPPHVYRSGWLADYPDPDNFLNLMTSYSENNHTHWGNKQFDQIIEKAVGELDVEKRKKMYKDAQEILVAKEAPVFPVFSMVSHVLISSRVKKLVENSLDKIDFKQLELE